MSVNPYEMTVFDDNVIGNMIHDARMTQTIKENAGGDEELEVLLNKITKFKGNSQRYN